MAKERVREVAVLSHLLEFRHNGTGIDHWGFSLRASVSILSGQ